MKIRRYAYATATELYELEITEELVKSYNEHFHNNFKLPENFVDLTVEDVIAIYKEEEDSRYNEEIENEKWNWKTTLGSIIKEFISNDLWDSYVEIRDQDTEDWDDEIVED